MGDCPFRGTGSGAGARVERPRTEPRDRGGVCAAMPTGELRRDLRPFLLELPLYAVLVAGYLAVVLHVLGAWIQVLFHQHRSAYAAVALVLIVAQGFVLEQVTHVLVRWVQPRRARSHTVPR